MQREGVRHPKHLRYSAGTFLKICICVLKKSICTKWMVREKISIFFTIFGLIELPMSSRPTYQQYAILKSKPSISDKKDQIFVLVDLKKKSSVLGFFLGGFVCFRS